MTVEETATRVVGTVDVRPSDVLAGQSAEAQLTSPTRGTVGVAGYPLLVEVVSGPAATVHADRAGVRWISRSASRARSTLPLETRASRRGPYVARLRGGAVPVTLDRADFVVHGLIAPPSPHAPADGATVDTAHPLLVVNDASSPEAGRAHATSSSSSATPPSRSRCRARRASRRRRRARRGASRRPSPRTRRTGGGRAPPTASRRARGARSSGSRWTPSTGRPRRRARQPRRRCREASARSPR